MTTPSRNDSPPPVALPVFAAPPDLPQETGNYGPGQPRPRPVDSESPTSEMILETEEPRRPSLMDRFRLGSPKPESAGGTPSPTSSPEPGGKRALANPGDAATLIAGLLIGIAAGVAWFVQAKTGGQRTLRTPTETQREDISKPLGRIAARHVPADLLNADLADGIKAISAVGAYVTAGPIVVKPTTEEPA